VTKILQTETATADSKQFDEPAEHIISACPILAKEHYIQRHDRVYVQLHFNTSKAVGVKLDSEYWYDHVPKSVEASHEYKVTLLWNQV
jgi:hypothetical protein